MKIRRTLLVAAAATFASCVAYGQSIHQTLGGRSSVVDSVEAGLATQMRTAAHALEQGRRHVATDALNRARHLADASAFDDTLDPNRLGQLRDAYDSIERARHSLQNGDEDGAQEALNVGAQALDRVDANARDPSPDGVRAGGLTARARGLTALDAKGRILGTVVNVHAEGDSIVVELRHGGFLGLGAQSTTVRVRGLLVGRHYAVVS